MTRQNEFTNGWRVGAARLNRAALILFREGERVAHQIVERVERMNAEIEARILAHQ